VDEVCDIIGHHHWPRAEETKNFKCLYDADLIVNLEEEMKRGNGRSHHTLERIIAKAMLTETGRLLAKQVLLAREGETGES
jgi:hypothetical protein